MFSAMYLVNNQTLESMNDNEDVEALLKLSLEMAWESPAKLGLLFMIMDLKSEMLCYVATTVEVISDDCGVVEIYSPTNKTLKRVRITYIVGEDGYYDHTDVTIIS